MVLENVKWTDVIWSLLTPKPTRDGETLQGLRYGTTQRLNAQTTYGDLAVNGEDSLTLIPVWNAVHIGERSTIFVGDSQWTDFRSEGTEHFFREDQTIRIETPIRRSWYTFSMPSAIASPRGSSRQISFSGSHTYTLTIQAPSARPL